MPFIEPLTLDAWSKEIQSQIEQMKALHSNLCAAEALAAEDRAMIARLKGENAILEAENARLRKALTHLDKASGEVARMGAVCGPQWTRLNIALFSSRAALKEK